MKRAIVLIVLLLAACATPPGQVKESELVFEEKTLKKNYQLVYKNFLSGFEMCASESIFIPDPIGFPECAANLDSRDVQCVIYHTQIFGPRADRVLGRFRITGTADGLTTVRGGYSPKYAKKESLAFWMRFAEGNYQCR